MPLQLDQTLYEGQIVIVTCWCGIRLGVPSELRTAQLAKHNAGGKLSIYCPLGHTFVPAGRSDAERLKDNLEWERKNSQFWREQSETAGRRLSAAKGQQTKLKNRIAKGVCPCCNRSFADLARHIAGQHPDFAPTVDQDVASLTAAGYREG